MVMWNANAGGCAVVLLQLPTLRVETGGGEEAFGRSVADGSRKSPTSSVG